MTFGIDTINTETKPKYLPIRPLRAFWYFIKANRNPVDTDSALLMQLYLHGNEHEALYQRFRMHPLGQEIIARKQELYQKLHNANWLRSLPESTLGNAYQAFLDANNLDTAVLDSYYVRLDPTFNNLDDERKRVLRRVRGMHDLWHVVLGYGTDVSGEIQIMVFMNEQIPNRSFRFATALIKLFQSKKYPNICRLIADAKIRAQTCEWLPVQDWESLLEKPLKEVRDILRVGPPPKYEAVYA